jgi:hypothetical protein
MSRNQKVLCGVDRDLCTGGILKASNGLAKDSIKCSKVHNDPQSAFECMKQSLLRQGFKQVGTKEFLDPRPGGYIRVLTRPSRFGGTLRLGKEHTRWMPKGRYGGILF